MTDTSRSARLAQGEQQEEQVTGDTARMDKMGYTDVNPPQPSLEWLARQFVNFYDEWDKDPDAGLCALVDFLGPHRDEVLAALFQAPRPEPHGMPNEHQNLWRLLKQIQGWSVSIIFHAHEAQTGRRTLDPDEIMAIGRRIEKASDLAFEKLQAARKEIDCDF